MQDRLVVIAGPTAVGKSAVAVELARMINGEIISGDSVQVYRRLDIGSAKVTAAEQQGIPHFMLDILDPEAEFSVAMFQETVRGYIRKINGRGKIPILVGGTGLYIRSVIDPYEFPETGEDKEIRLKLQALAEREGREAVHSLLAKVDPVSAQRLHPNDLTRVVRALEVYHLTGSPFSNYQNGVQNAGPSEYKLAFFGLTAERSVLYERINQRVDAMLAQGLLDEVKSLLADGVYPFSQSLRSIGYRHAVQYLRGMLSEQEMVRLLKRDTRRFAKRQLTWFNRDERIQWFYTDTQGLKEIASQMAQIICKTP